MENLEKMLQKIVYLNDYKGIEVTGFLLKMDDEYIVKVIDSKNDKYERHDVIKMDERLAKFIEISDRPKLMKASMKSTGYKVMKYVLRSNVPTPHTMQNGCPYFWLMIFSYIAITFVFLGRKIGKFLYELWKLPGRGIDAIADRIAENWLNNLSENEVVDYFHNTNNKNRSLFNGKIYDDRYSWSTGRRRVYYEWIKKNYGFDPEDQPEKYDELFERHRAEYSNQA